MEKLNAANNKHKLYLTSFQGSLLNQCEQLNTSKIIKIYQEVFYPLKNLYKISSYGKEYNEILDTFLDEL